MVNCKLSVPTSNLVYSEGLSIGEIGESYST